MSRTWFPGSVSVAYAHLARSLRRALALICVAGVAATGGTTSAQTPVDPTIVAEQMNLAGTDIVTVEIGTSVTASDVLTLTVPIDGVPSTITLQPHTNRAPGYVLKIQLEDGSYAEVQPGPIQTLRGEVAEIAGADVAASMLDDGLHAMILLPDDTTYWLEPAASVVAGAAPDQYMLYRDDDVLDTGRTCSMLDPAPDGKHAHAHRSHDLRSGDTATASVAGTGAPFLTELAIDADFEYFTKYGTVEAVEQQIESIINTVNLQYERDVNITHVITTLIVRTAEPDPYSSSDPGTLLTQFRQHWNFNQVAVHRDMAQLFTGRAIDNTVIGIAWRGVPGTSTVCGSFGYSVVESDCFFSCNSFASKTDLSAHELGHNWGADHCGCGPTSFDGAHTMNATITSANRFHPTASIPEIEAYRDTRTCISPDDELRRIILTADADEVNEFGQVQLSVTADLRFGGDQDVTNQVDWTLGRPVGWISQTTGVLTTFDVLGDLCLSVTASYTFNDITKTDQKVIRIIDLDAPLHISLSDPPDGAIDAAQPSDPEATVPMGWKTIDVVLNGEVCNATRDDFAVSELNGFPPVPTVIDAEQLSVNSFRLTFDIPIEPGAWSMVTYVPSGSFTTLGFLPGDVDGNTVSDADDVAALVDVLTGVGPTLPDWATDLNRSGQTTPADLITLIDLLNGGGGFFPWNGATLP